MTHSPARVLLLGGTGFVGRHVCEKLTRMGCSMTVITRRASQASACQKFTSRSCSLKAMFTTWNF
jgi:uncharacterized protein YbjT (DUF2867 family)